MRTSLKVAAGLLANLAMFSNSVLAYLPISFEETKSPGVPMYPELAVVNESNFENWRSFNGEADITPSGQGYGGGKALRVNKDPLGEAWLRREVTWDAAESIAFIDFRIKPAGDPAGSPGNFLANGSQLAFQVSESDATAGQLWVYHGNDGESFDEAGDEGWLKTAGTFVVPSGATASSTWMRITLRHDYQRNLWDLFIDGKLSAVNLGFDGREDLLRSLEFFGSKGGDTLVDDLGTDSENMLFPDDDKDGLPNAWEDANGSNKNLYDRESIKPGTGSSFLSLYIASLSLPSAPVNGFSPPVPPAPGAVPPISVLHAHQVVGALKGQFSVGGDGAATYTMPIDIPKGRAGLEPQLSLNYSSNGGNGPMGVGWSLGGLQKISRGPSSHRKDGIGDGVNFDDSDRFFLDGQRLVCVNGTYGKSGSEYRTEVDSYSRILAYGTTNQAPTYWTVETKSGLKLTFGGSADSRVDIGSYGTQSWLINEVADTTGKNAYRVDYRGDSVSLATSSASSRYPWKVRYTLDPTSTSDNGFSSVTFRYDDDFSPVNTPRADRTSGYLLGHKQEANRRLDRIDVHTGAALNHAYNLTYVVSQQTGRPLLTYVDKEASDGSRIPGTYFEWDTLLHDEPKWLEVGQLDFNEYGSGEDSASDMASFVSVSETDPTEIHLTGNAWRTYPFSYNVTSSTVLKFDYKTTSVEPKWGMIGLDEDSSTANPKRLFKLVGGLYPPVPAYSDNSYKYTTPGSWKTITINIGQAYTGQMNFLALVSDDNTVGGGVGESWFKNIKVYQSSQNPANVAPIAFEQSLASPRVISGTNEDLGVRIQDLNADGLPDISYNLLHSKTTADGPVTLSTFGQALRNTGSEFVNDTTLKLPSNIPTATLPGGGEGTWASSQAIIPVPLDIDGDERLDYAYARNLTRDGTKWSYEHGYMTWNGSAWVDKSSYVHKFWSWCDSSQKRFSHLEHVDLDSDGDLDVVVHPYGAKLYLYNGTRTQTVLVTGNSGENAGMAYLNRHDERDGTGAIIGWEAKPELRLPEQLRIPGFNNHDGEVGRGLQDLNGDGRPDIYSNLWPVPDEVWHHDPNSTYIDPDTSSLSYWVPQPSADPEADPPPPPLTSLPEDITNTNGEDIGTRLVDLNGDGFVDLIKALGSGSMNLNVGVYLNKGGTGWLMEADAHGGPWAPEENFNTVDKRGEMKEQGTSFVDLNADGLTDFVVSKYTRNTVFFNTGSTWWAESSPDSNGNPVGNTFWATGGAGSGSTSAGKWELPFRIYPNTGASSEGIRHAMLVDLNGDGVSDLIGDMKSAVPRIWINQAKPERIVSFTDGFGSRLVVDEYCRLNDPTPLPYTGKRVYEKPAINPATGLLDQNPLPAGHAAVQDGRWVVGRYSEPDGRGGRRYRSQRYGDLRYDRLNETSLGFGWVEVHDELTGGFSRTYVRRDYPFAGSPSYVRSYVNVAATMSHEPSVTTGLKQVSEEFHDYGVLAAPSSMTGGVIVRPVETYSLVRKWDLTRKVDANLAVTATGNLLSEVESEQEAFNEDGFLLSSTVTSLLDGSQTHTTNTYQNRGTTWLIGRLTGAEVSKSAPGKTTIEKETSFAYDPGNGLLVMEKVHDVDGVAPDLSVTTTYDHDDYGNVETTLVEASGETRKSKTLFRTDSGYNARFATAEISYLGNVETEYARVEHTYDTTRALLASTIADTKTTTFGYDSFGTLIQTNHPNLTVSAEVTRFAANSYLPAQVRQELGSGGSIRWARSAQASGTPWATVYFDGAGRELVKETVVMTDGSGSSSVFETQYAVTRYDSRGRVEATSNPFVLGDPVYWTVPHYDCLDRVFKTTRPDGAEDATVAIVTETEPSGTNPLVRTEVTNPRGNTLKRWTDQHGRLVKSTDPSGQFTVFTHDVENRLVSVAIDSVPQIVNRWDGMGNKTGVWDLSSGVAPPSGPGDWSRAGISTLTYNGFGEVVSAVNALQETTTTEYDKLGRVVKVTRPNGEGEFTTQYKSDSPAKGSAWKVTSTTGYLEEIEYWDTTSAWGLVKKTTKRQSTSEATFVSEAWYNALGLVSATKDAGGAQVNHYYDSVYGSFPIERALQSTWCPTTTIWHAGSTDHVAGSPPLIRSTETLAHDVIRTTDHDARNGRLIGIESTGLGRGSSAPLQKLAYTWDANGNLLTRNDQVADKTETFAYDNLDRLDTSTIGSNTVDYSYHNNGNLEGKGVGKALQYEEQTLGSTTFDSHRVKTATIAGATREYDYDAAGHVTEVADLTTPSAPRGSAPRTYQWTSFGQLKWVSQQSCPALQTFAQTGAYAPQIPGIAASVVYQPSRGEAAFSFDAGGSRAKQVLTRTFSDQSTATSITDYAGSYELERHETTPFNGVPTSVKTLHRHDLGGALFTREVGSSTPGVRLAVVLTDHIGSTDVIVRAELSSGAWQTLSGNPRSERQSFDAWGEHRAAADWTELRITDSANRRTSAMDYDRGFTGHEMLDDFGLVHMNGRIYDPELGRFLSPDPYVQVPEYSQNFNRYSYVLNNPLSYTDPTGHFTVGYVHYLHDREVDRYLRNHPDTAQVVNTAITIVLSIWGGGPIVAGAVGGALNARLNGGDMLQAAAVGAFQGWVTQGLHYISPNYLSGVAADLGGSLSTGSWLTSFALHTVGHGIVGGLSNAAMGGKFQDGFISAAVSAAAFSLGIDRALGLGSSGSFWNSPRQFGDYARLIGRTAVAAIIGGTASAVGGGKFGNGAWTAAFQHLVNQEGAANVFRSQKYTGSCTVATLANELRLRGVKGWDEDKIIEYMADFRIREVAKNGVKLDTKTVIKGVQANGVTFNEIADARLLEKIGLKYELKNFGNRDLKTIGKSGRIMLAIKSGSLTRSGTAGHAVLLLGRPNNQFEIVDPGDHVQLPGGSPIKSGMYGMNYMMDNLWEAPEGKHNALILK